jgi:hypothetical protein
LVLRSVESPNYRDYGSYREQNEGSDEEAAAKNQSAKAKRLDPRNGSVVLKVGWVCEEKQRDNYAAKCGER